MSAIARCMRPGPSARWSRAAATGLRRYSTPASRAAPLPLDGFRVLDMTRVLAGVSRDSPRPHHLAAAQRQLTRRTSHTARRSWATLGAFAFHLLRTVWLMQCSAEVIKVEHPVRGDDTRAWGPPYAEYKPGSGVTGPGEAAYFLGANRNKKSLGLSFQHSEGVDILHKLVAKCDILVENYLPGTLKRYSMDYETLRNNNPGLIYASITGYGQTGPYSSRAGYDVMVEAEFGLMHITGSRDGPPVKVGVAVTDLTTGLYTSNSIMAALLGRAKTGKGQHIDVALSDCQTATLANIASSCLISGKRDTGRWGTAHRKYRRIQPMPPPTIAHPSSASIVPYRSFKTKDGDILFGGGNDRLFGVLCDGLGRPQWKDDAKFKTNADRVANRVELEAEIEAVSQQKTTQEWLETFEGSGMPYAAVNDVQDTLNHEHTKARDMVVEMEHEACGPIKMVNTPVKFSESQPTIRSVPPMLGQHTDEVLSEHLGLSESDIAGLKKQGVVS
ncbi:Succinate--hydroxymethylglutarate CoA-transferase [Tolypocladium paradoxum]|uniref:Succinate--hydroxymethylglutarate CoA-transferase n=1 Tax=Tolypocladium paradoxum TaxID=94208 RepID=A0A2S4L2A2_9HYPO|nr:Succinate--hydroxymethylglutarate CoA-transferase [Tolypocladium paradoxum]